MSMINTRDIMETINMISGENLDVRTVTMGISLLDCADPDPKRACEKIYNKITARAAGLKALHAHALADAPSAVVVDVALAAEVAVHARGRIADEDLIPRALDGESGRRAHHDERRLRGASILASGDRLGPRLGRGGRSLQHSAAQGHSRDRGRARRRLGARRGRTLRFPLLAPVARPHGLDA